MKATPMPTSTTTTQNLTAEPEELVRVRAYELYEHRGCEHGHDLEDWLQAENEIRMTRTRRAAA